MFVHINRSVPIPKENVLLTCRKSSSFSSSKVSNTSVILLSLDGAFSVHLHSITPGYPIREPYAGDCRVPISVSVLSQPDADKINESVSSIYNDKLGIFHVNQTSICLYSTSEIWVRLVPPNMLRSSSNVLADHSKAVLLLWILFVICVSFFVCHIVLSVPCSLVVTCWERADLLVL